MRSAIIILLLLALVTCGIYLSQQSIDSQLTAKYISFQNFKQTFQKSYQNQQEESYRLEIFLKNYEKIQKLSKKYPKAQFGLTQFMDLTQQEFDQRSMGYISYDFIENDEVETDISDNLNLKQIKTEDLPKELSYKEKSKFVKDQGLCGGCYAFASTTMLEIKSQIDKPLSAQQVLDCAPDLGCDGGYLIPTLDYLEKHGVVYDKYYSYVGPLMVPIYVPNEDEEGTQWNFYEGGILEDNPLGIKSKGRYRQNHVVVLVGYTEEYWIIQNSWGQNWGENGFARIQMGNHFNICVKGAGFEWSEKQIQDNIHWPEW